MCLAFPTVYIQRNKEHPASQKTLCCFSKGTICPFLNNCLLQAHFCPPSPLSDLICANYCYSATSTCTQELHWKMLSSSFWNTVSLPLALCLPPGCIRPATKFWFRNPLFPFETTRNYIWLICKKTSCSYGGCQE